MFPMRMGSSAAQAATGASSVATPIPPNTSGGRPRYVHVAVSAAAFVLPGDLDVVVSAGTAATGVLTAAGQPTDGETVTIDGKVYTFQDTLTNVDGNVLIGATASDSLDNLIAAIMGTAGAGTTYAAATTRHPTVNAAAGVGDTVDVTARGEGTWGNAIGTTEDAAQLSWGAATLTGGTAVGARVDPAAPLVLAVHGQTHIAHIQESGAGTITIVPLEQE